MRTLLMSSLLVLGGCVPQSLTPGMCYGGYYGGVSCVPPNTSLLEVWRPAVKNLITKLEQTNEHTS